MALAGLLPHQVKVYRRSGRKDRFGQKVDQNPRQATAGQTLVGTYPCRAFQKSGGLQMEERNVDTFTREFEMFTEVDVDIREDDAVEVTDPVTGHSVLGRAKVKSLEVVYTASRPHHCEFTLWEQSGPDTVGA